MSENNKEQGCGWLATLPNIGIDGTRTVVQDFYDGPTRGVIMRHEDDVACKFEMLDWDDNQELRLFRVSHLRGEYFNQIVSAYSEYDQPRWPLWMPYLGGVPEPTREATYKKVRSLINTAGPVSCVVAWRNSDTQVIAAKKVTEADRVLIPDWRPWEEASTNTDWFSYLGIIR